jgi:DNA repair exonuclease SbcCD ATPase subunit
MQTMDELAKLKSEMQKDDLGKVTETLQLTQEKARLAEQNRELERKLDVYQQRCQEYEMLLQEKATGMESAQKELAILKSETSGSESKMLMLEE